MDDQQRKKIVVVGDGFCGKTSMLFAFSKDQFLTDYIPTICETFVKEVQVDGEKVELVLWDTAGQEDYDRLRPVSYNRTHAVIICFSVDDRTSYDNVRLKWIKEINHFCPNVPAILVATKLDLRDELGAKRTLSAVEGSRLAAEIGASAYSECSAKTRVGIQRVFETATKEVLKQRIPTKKSRISCLLS